MSLFLLRTMVHRANRSSSSRGRHGLSGNQRRVRDALAAAKPKARPAPVKGPVIDVDALPQVC